MTIPVTSITPVNTSIKAPQKIWNGGTGIAPLIVNNDPLNTLYIGSQADVLRIDTTSTIPIEPLGAQVWGDVDIWAFAPVTVNTCLIIPGGTLYQPSPAQVAISAAGLATAVNQTTQIGHESSIDNSSFASANYLGGVNPGALIANAGLTVGQEAAALLATGSATGTPGGVPLLHGWDDIAASAQAIPAASSVTLANLTFKKPGYIVSFWGEYSGANGTIPFVLITFTWKNAANGDNLSQEQWIVPVTANGGFLPTYGKGPTKGATLSIKLTNFDPAQPVSMSYDISETTQHITRDDWRSATPIDVPGFTSAPGADPFALIEAAAQNLNINGNQTLTYQLPVYAGAVWITLEASIATGIQFAIEAQDYETGVTNVLYSVNPIPANYVSGLAYLPRMPCRLIIFNGNAGAENVTFSIMAQEYAS